MPGASLSCAAVSLFRNSRKGSSIKTIEPIFCPNPHKTFFVLLDVINIILGKSIINRKPLKLYIFALRKYKCFFARMINEHYKNEEKYFSRRVHSIKKSARESRKKERDEQIETMKPLKNLQYS